MPSTTATPVSARSGTPYLWPLRVAVLAQAAVLLVEFVTAGQLVSGEFGALSSHSTGAVVLHVVAAVQVVAAALLRWPGRGPVLPSVLSVLALFLGLGQAYLGSQGRIDFHVPVALLLVTVVTWVLVWTWSASAHRALP